jgi:predicted RND superfamily exporter protein
MIGFGSLAVLGTFRGIATLGALLALGAGVTMLASLIILPAAAVRLKSIQNTRQEVTNEI